jgi:hypothetical protein
VSNGAQHAYARRGRKAAVQRASESIFSEAERADIVSMVAADPECGTVMEGTGGFRKVRIGRDGMGKRGGHV